MSQPTVIRWLRGLRQFMKYQQLKGKETVKFIGQDHLGNKYYEAYRPNHIRPNQRYFDRPKVEGPEDVADAANVPPLWDSWLRYRRREPPTEEEMLNAEDYFKTQQAMAAGRKAQESGEKEPELRPKESSLVKRTPLKRPNRIPDANEV